MRKFTTTGEIEIREGRVLVNPVFCIDQVCYKQGTAGPVQVTLLFQCEGVKPSYSVIRTIELQGDNWGDNEVEVSILALPEISAIHPEPEQNS